VIPFGIGKRYCLGQSLAEKEFFIFATGLIQQFQFNPDPGSTLPSYVDIFPTFSMARPPPPFKVIIKKKL
jgi:cytochrome P450